MSAYNEDALWWLQDKTLFKLLGKNSSSGIAGVQGSPQSVPPLPEPRPAERPSEPRAPHCSPTCVSPVKKEQVATVGFADEHSVA